MLKREFTIYHLRVPIDVSIQQKNIDHEFDLVVARVGGTVIGSVLAHESYFIGRSTVYLKNFALHHDFQTNVAIREAILASLSQLYHTNTQIVLPQDEIRDIVLDSLPEYIKKRCINP